MISKSKVGKLPLMQEIWTNSSLGNSLERIQGYLTIEQEAKPTSEGVPPAYWPASGSLVVEKLSARYSQNGPKVLHDISFEVKPGERVGIGTTICEIVLTS